MKKIEKGIVKKEKDVVRIISKTLMGICLAGVFTTVAGLVACATPNESVKEAGKIVARAGTATTVITAVNLFGYTLCVGAGKADEYRGYDDDFVANQQKKKEENSLEK